MSLINDALKRASQSDRKRPAQAALPRPMQPAAAPARARNSWLLAAIIVAVLGFALAGLSFWKWWGATHPVVATAPAQPVQSVQTIVESPPPAAPKPVPIIQEAPPPVAAAAPAPVPALATPVIVAVPVPVVKPAWPIELTAKAIFYSKIHPHALVNGRTVEPGDKIDGVLVTGIEPDRVVVEWNGEKKELLMGGQ
jgi:hypothetical protein